MEFQNRYLALVIIGKGTTCIPDQHKINAIIKISYIKIIIKWVSMHDLKQFTVLEFVMLSGRLFQSIRKIIISTCTS